MVSSLARTITLYTKGQLVQRTQSILLAFLCADVVITSVAMLASSWLPKTLKANPYNTFVQNQTAEGTPESFEVDSCYTADDECDTCTTDECDDECDTISLAANTPLPESPVLRESEPPV